MKIVLAFLGLLCAITLLIFLQQAGPPNHEEDRSLTRTDRESLPKEPADTVASPAVPSTGALAESREVQGGTPSEHETFDEALDRFFTEEFLAAWPKHRSDEPSPETIESTRVRFRDAVDSLPAQLAQQMARKLTEQEEGVLVLERGDGSRILELVDDGAIHLDADQIPPLAERVMHQRQAGPHLEGEKLEQNEDVDAGAVIRFGRGVHALKNHRRFSYAKEFPADISIIGAGIDETVVHIRGLSAIGNVERLSIANLTIFTMSGPFFNLHGGKLVLDLENVRLLGFDSGAGGSNLFSIRGAFIRATGCEILGGYGRSPGGGSFARDGPLLCLFDSCHFESMKFPFPSGRNAALFRNCSFALPGPNPIEGSAAGFVFEGCSYEEMEPLSRRDQKELSDLLPHLYP